MMISLHVVRFIRESRGQDLVEYALLAALIGIAATAAAPTLQTAIGSAYTTWTTANQNEWRIPDPGAGGS
jgi:pilus assembly protein Flp/PilA